MIDFDLGGVERTHTYPEGYYVGIGDAKRHNDARALRTMLRQHDWYSLGTVMEMFCAEDDEEGRWKEAGKLLIEATESPLLAAVDLLQNIRDAALVPKSPPVSTAGTGTGSPPKLGNSMNGCHA